MSALDFDNYKKISQDKKSATLRHPDGHEFKISLGGIKSDLKEKLDALPLHLAEGSEEPVEAMDDSSPAEASDTPAAAAPEPAPTPMASAPQAAHEVIPAALTPEQAAAEKTADNLKFGQDLTYGHVQPKTYSDLFAEKSTLGKLGTMFGLLVSGAGAGLTHQPNAVMQMMDRQIQNDLEAQKTNQTNKQTWYKLSLEHVRNQNLNALTNSETFKNATEVDKERMINAQMGVSNLEATTQAKNSMMVSYIHDQQLLLNRMPPGPQRDAAQQKLNMMAQAAQSQIYANNLDVEKKKAQVSQNPPPVSKKPGQAAAVKKAVAVEDGPIDQNAYHDMVKKGALFAKSGYIDPKKGIDPADNKSVESAITESKVNWENYKDVMEVANTLANKKNAGESKLGRLGDAARSIPWIGDATASALHFAQGNEERERKILVDALANRLAGHGASDKTINDVRSALTPNMFDNPKTLKSLEGTIYQHFAHNDKEKNAMWEKYPKIKKELPKIPLKVGEETKQRSDKQEKTRDLVSKFGKDVGATE